MSQDMEGVLVERDIKAGAAHHRKICEHSTTEEKIEMLDCGVLFSRLGLSQPPCVSDKNRLGAPFFHISLTEPRGYRAMFREIV